MEKINICFTSPSKRAYSETFIQNLKEIIDGNIFYCYGGYFPTESEDGELKSHDAAPLILKGFSKIGWINKPIRETYLESYLKKKKIQLLITNYGQSGAELAQVSKRLNISLIVHFHGFDASVKEVLDKYSISYQKMFEIAKAIVVVSSEMERKLLELGAPKEKINLLRYAPSPLFSSTLPDYQSNQILAIGRFVKKKAPYLTLLALKKAQEQCPDLRIKFVGEGELLSICKDIAQSLKIQNVDFVGVLTPSSIVKEMEQSFCFVQHSKTASNGDKEGTPVAVLEAMASAIPVISTYHAGISDVVRDSENGFLVKEGDVEGMAESIVRLFENRELAKRYGENGRSFIKENLTQEKYKEKWNNLILNVVNGK